MRIALIVLLVACQAAPSLTNGERRQTPSLTDSAEKTAIAEVTIGEQTHGLVTDGRAVYTLGDKLVYQLTRDGAQDIFKLAFAATDLAISPDGKTLVASHPSVHKLSRIDIASGDVALVNTLSDAQRVLVTNDGRAVYVEDDQWTEVHAIDMAVGLDSDKVVWQSVYQGALAWNGANIVIAESSLSGSNLVMLDASFKPISESNHDDGYGFPYPQRHVYAGPAHIYYAQTQIALDDLTFEHGRIPQVFAEHVSGKIAVGTDAVYDAELLTKIAELSPAASAATFIGNTLYWLSGDNLYVANADEWLAMPGLGVRAYPGRTLQDYAFAKLAVNNARAEAYGIDRTTGRVVALAFDGGYVRGEITVGDTATELAVIGDKLYVGHQHTKGLAEIDLATWTLSRFVRTGLMPCRVNAVSQNRLIVTDHNGFGLTAVIDITTGVQLASRFNVGRGPLAVGGDSIFVGDFGLQRLDLNFVVTSSTDLRGDTLAVMPDASRVFYAGRAFDGADLRVIRYEMPDTIVATGSAYAASTTAVYEAATGTRVLDLPQGTENVAFFERDGHVWAFATGASGGDLVVVR